MKNYLDLTGQAEDGARLSTNTETSGRYHTDWLRKVRFNRWGSVESLAVLGKVRFNRQL